MNDPGESPGAGRSLVGRTKSLAVRLMARLPHAARAAALVGIAFVFAACSDAANPLGIRWVLSPDGRAGIPRVFENRLPEVRAKKALEMLRSHEATFVDARDAKDYQENHIPGAISIPMRQWNTAWPQMRHKVSRKATLLLYCYGGKCGLSTRMGKRLLELGYEKPIVLEYGWKEWAEARFPTVKPLPPAKGGR
jgi:rhodanese-related sulfurtransferase